MGYKVSIPYTKTSLEKFNEVNVDKLSVLNKFRHSIFSYREVKVFNILQSILNLEHQLKVCHTPIGSLLCAEKFDAIWEEMLRFFLFSKPEKYNKLFYTGKYFLFDSEVSKTKYLSRLDIVVEEKYCDNDYLFILDAKNYIL